MGELIPHNGYTLTTQQEKNMEYYFDGARITERDAARIVESAALEQGWDLEEAAALWRGRTNEEARDTLYDLSGYSLEIVA